MAKTYRVRPAALLGLERNVADSYLAFAIDRAVWVFGTSIEYDMDQAENHPSMNKATQDQRTAARRAVWDAYCYPDGKTVETESAPPPKGRFADPMLSIKANTTGR